MLKGMISPSNQMQITYFIHRALKQKEVDRILDKISKRGLDSLSDSEKATLEEFRKK